MNQAIKDQIEQIAPQIVTTTRDAFFDPLEYLSEHVTEDNLAQKLLATGVWAIDSQIVNAATAMFFDVRSENPEVKDITQLCDVFKGTYDLEGYWGQGNARKLVNLLALQPAWHEAAIAKAMATGWLTYQPRSIDELVANQRPMPIRAETIENLKVNAAFIVEGTDESAEEAHKKLIAQKLARAERMANDRRALLPAVRCFVAEARIAIVHLNQAPTFSDLPTAARLTVMTTLKTGIGNALSDLADRTDTNTYTMCMREATQISATFRRVIDKLARDLQQERASD